MTTINDIIGRLEKATDYIGYLLVVYAPTEAVVDASTKFGTWCLSHAGGWAVRCDARKSQ